MEAKAMAAAERCQLLVALAPLVRAAAAGTAEGGGGRQHLAAAVAATAPHSEKLDGEEQVGLAARLLAGKTVPGSVRFERNFAAHVGIGEGADVLILETEEKKKKKKKKQRGQRRGRPRAGQVAMASVEPSESDSSVKERECKQKERETNAREDDGNVKIGIDKAAQQAAAEQVSPCSDLFAPSEEGKQTELDGIVDPITTNEDGGLEKSERIGPECPLQKRRPGICRGASREADGDFHGGDAQARGAGDGVQEKIEKVVQHTLGHPVCPAGDEYAGKQKELESIATPGTMKMFGDVANVKIAKAVQQPAVEQVPHSSDLFAPHGEGKQTELEGIVNPTTMKEYASESDTDDVPPWERDDPDDVEFDRARNRAFREKLGHILSFEVCELIYEDHRHSYASYEGHQLRYEGHKQNYESLPQSYQGKLAARIVPVEVFGHFGRAAPPRESCRWGDPRTYQNESLESYRLGHVPLTRHTGHTRQFTILSLSACSSCIFQDQTSGWSSPEVRRNPAYKLKQQEARRLAMQPQAAPRPQWEEQAQRRVAAQQQQQQQPDRGQRRKSHSPSPPRRGAAAREEAAAAAAEEQRARELKEEEDRKQRDRQDEDKRRRKAQEEEIQKQRMADMEKAWAEDRAERKAREDSQRVARPATSDLRLQSQLHLLRGASPKVSGTGVQGPLLELPRPRPTGIQDVGDTASHGHDYVAEDAQLLLGCYRRVLPRLGSRDCIRELWSTGLHGQQPVATMEMRISARGDQFALLSLHIAHNIGHCLAACCAELDEAVGGVAAVAGRLQQGGVRLCELAAGDFFKNLQGH
ncbi:unnamed protein product [Prorocentrum cordatum]|uniref:Uncharacterized protein n=1 Tax=Prorocentrum cordatum TaxID=2364126 RepID=A0ABN9SQL3_9DINO|nr:unnamed protein product [Polarella glacialis]